MLVKELRAARWAILAALLIVAQRALDGGGRGEGCARPNALCARGFASRQLWRRVRRVAEGSGG